MRNPILKTGCVLLLGGILLSSCGRSQESAPAAVQTQEGTGEATPDPSTHQDHQPKHGGQFFMALDNEHHLEGVLLKPRTFRLYLYDSRTQPVDLARLKATKAELYWGYDTDSKPMKLAAREDGLALETELDKLPTFADAALTLLITFPGVREPDAKPELFTFSFEAYSETPANPQGGDSTEPHKHP